MADENDKKSDGGGWAGPFLLGIAVMVVGTIVVDELRWRRLQRRAQQAELEEED